MTVVHEDKGEELKFKLKVSTQREEWDQTRKVTDKHDYRKLRPLIMDEVKALTIKLTD